MYDVEFWNTSRMHEFWDMVSGLLTFASPSVLIAISVLAAGMFLMIVIKAMKQSADDDRDDEEYEIKYYD